MYKKLFAAVLCVIMLVSVCPVQAFAVDDGFNVGDGVLMGYYEQDGNYSNGEESIEWIIIAKKNGKILLLSKYVLDAKPYDCTGESTTWKKVR